MIAGYDLSKILPILLVMRTRTRDWRRHMEDHKFKKRLQLSNRGHWYIFEDANWKMLQSTSWMDLLGSGNRAKTYLYKSQSTPSGESKYKSKYSPNKNKGCYRDKKLRMNSTSTREGDKRMLERRFEFEYNIKHLNTGLEELWLD